MDTELPTASTPQPADSQQSAIPPKKNKLLIYGILLYLVVAVLGVAGFYMAVRNDFPNVLPNILQPDQNDQVMCTMEALICPDGSAVGRSGPNCEFAPCPTPTSTQGSEIPSDWETLQTSAFRVQYPANMEVTDQENGNYALVLTGPTQAEGTELFDGASVFIQTHQSDLQIENYIDQIVSDLEEEGGTEVLQARQTATIGKYSGYRYRTVGLGEYTHFFIQSTPTSPIVEIVTMVEDPENVGFQKIIDQVLSSIELL